LGLNFAQLPNYQITNNPDREIESIFKKYKMKG